MALGTAHNRMNTGNQFILVEWLGHVVISAKTETANLVFNAGQTGKNEDRGFHL